MLQDEIIKIGEYFRGIEYFNDALMVKVQFPFNWVVYPSENNLIKPAKSETLNGEYYYYGDMNSVTLDEIFNLIKETIDANKNAELKVQLLNNKIAELKELFSKTPYEKLVMLKYIFDEPVINKKPKRKYNRKKKEESEIKVEQQNNEEEKKEQE